MTNTLWSFDTARFRVALECEIDQDADLSWRDEDQIAYDADNGVEYWQFDVVVYLDGKAIARDSLGCSGYSDTREFFTAHRDVDPMNRNCSAMRAARGDNVCICHYFPGMVWEAIREARKALGNVPRLRTVD